MKCCSRKEQFKRRSVFLPQPRGNVVKQAMVRCHPELSVTHPNRHFSDTLVKPGDRSSVLTSRKTQRSLLSDESHTILLPLHLFMSISLDAGNVQLSAPPQAEVQLRVTQSLEL